MYIIIYFPRFHGTCLLIISDKKKRDRFSVFPPRIFPEHLQHAAHCSRSRVERPRPARSPRPTVTSASGRLGPESPHTRRQRPGGRWPPLPAQGPALPGTHPSREWTPASSRRGRGGLAGSTGAGGEGQREPAGPPLASGPGLRGGSRRETALRDLGQDKADKDRRGTFGHGCEKRSLRPTGAGRYTRSLYSGQLR